MSDTKKHMRIIFFGTPDFAIPSLKALLHSEERVVAVVTQTDKRKGKGHTLLPPPVKEFAMHKEITILQPEKIKDPAFLKELSDMSPDIIVVVAYGKILPPQILKLPPLGCINIHASLLPKYRGAAPIQWTILMGERKTGITTILMDEGLDTGDILLQEETEITDEDTAETLGKRLSEIAASVLMKTIKGIKEGTLEPIPQMGTPSYAPLLKKEDGKIDWSKSATDINNLIRALYPWPSAYCYLRGERIKIIKVGVLKGSGIPGRIEKINKGELVVGTGEGIISITEVQPEGKRTMLASAFSQGRDIKEGTFFDES